MNACQDCNVVVCVREHRYQACRRTLSDFGDVHGTEFYNVLMLHVASIPQFMEDLRARFLPGTALHECLSRAVPVFAAFTFQTPEEFEAKARHGVSQWVPRLAGKAFHVRMHRRGFKGRLSSQDEERFLDRYLLERLAEDGRNARISFTDADVIVAVETVGQWAGMSCWDREEIRRFGCLGLD